MFRGKKIVQIEFINEGDTDSLPPAEKYILQTPHQW